MSSFTPVIYKVSGESLSKVSDGTYTPLSDERFNFVADEIRLLLERRFVPVVVVGGGNIFRGTGRSNFGIDSKKADEAGMKATGVNASLLHAFLSINDTDSVVRTRGDLGGVAWDSEETRSLLREGVVVILAGGMGEPGMSSDYPAVFHAHQIGARSVLVAKHGVDAVYSADPRVGRRAERIAEITCTEVLERGLEFMDRTAIEEARASQTTLFVFSAEQRGGGLNAVLNGECGTIVHPR